jgi:hypothetical protein
MSGDKFRPPFVRKTPLSVDMPGRCEPEVPFEEVTTEQLSLRSRNQKVAYTLLTNRDDRVRKTSRR